MTIVRRHPWEVVGLVAFALASLVMTFIVANTLARANDGDVHRYAALFTDSSGLRPGDDVRIAGVRVGRVESRVLEDGLAKIEFVVERDQQIRTDTIARVSYLNLLGQRYLALEAGSEVGEPVEPGSTLGTDRTRSALDLTELFNAFKPLFDALDPEDVNLIATEVVQTLQGEGPRFAHLMEQTAELTEHLATRDEVITRVIDNVTVVMEQTSTHRDDLSNVIAGLDGLVGDLADDRGSIDDAVLAIDRLSGSLDVLLDETADPLSVAIERFTVLGETLVENNDILGQTLTDTPDLLDGFNRALSHGSWLNTYVCTQSIGIGSGELLSLPGVGHSRPCR